MGTHIGNDLEGGLNWTWGLALNFFFLLVIFTRSRSHQRVHGVGFDLRRNL